MEQEQSPLPESASKISLNAILEAAQSYTIRGWGVFPLHSINKDKSCTCGNPQCEHQGKHPRTRNGVLDASTAEAQINEWFKQRPNSNIGIATGRKSGLLVIDVDGEGGEESIRDYEEKNGPLPDTLQVLTGRGLHYYFRHPGLPIKNRVRVFPGVDIRSDNGYVIAPPSLHISGKKYVFEVSTQEFESAEIPSALLALIISNETAGPDLNGSNGKIKEGSRNQTLTSIAGSLRRRGLDPETLAATLQYVNLERCDPPLPKKEVDAIAKSISHYPTEESGPNISILKQLATVREWPKPVGDDAYYGLAGEVVRIIEPHTEADPVGLLVQFLTATGNIVDRFPHFDAEGTSHFLNEFICLVGDTSKGRKGSSWAQVLRIFSSVAEQWTMQNIVTGLASGEGLIWIVRDPIEKTEPVRDEHSKQIIDYRVSEVDPGVKDKRLFIIEHEFASTLRQIERHGSILSAILRQGWETGCLRTITKNSPAKATSAHISVTAHITATELIRYLTRTEIANGLGNRFLFICVRRSKCLPEGGKLNPQSLASFIPRLSDVIQFASRVGEMHRDDGARELWNKIYPELSEGKPGLFGALAARSEAHVMRYACIYALLDRSPEIRLAHLKAALALWKYAESSIAYLFGEAIGSPLADFILSELRQHPEGLTLTQISELLGKHSKADEIGVALKELHRMKFIVVIEEKTAGRSAMRIMLKQVEAV